jgi:hypothetical protein
MKPILRGLTTLAAVALGAFSSSTVVPAQASSVFGQLEVDQSRFVAFSSRGLSDRGLIIVEQVSDSRACWDEAGANPTVIDPLLLDFNFTGICRRSTDRNGYSIRVNGEDMGLAYTLRVVPRDTEMVLMGIPRNESVPSVEIGRTTGVTNDFAKLTLDPGWRFTRRTYNDQVLGHIYLTYDGSFPPGDVIPDPGGPTTPPAVPRFRDTAGDIYFDDIQQAVEIGFIAGFEDNTFRPRETLTREQLVSMVLDALEEVPNANFRVPDQASGNPYRDVNAARWSAAKIQFARDNNIVSGYEDGTFRPDRPVSRAELISVLRRAASYAQTMRGSSADLLPTEPVFNFTDTSNHWANAQIAEMSAFCGVASPLNEQGRQFAPDNASFRNYAAAATLRMLSCVQLPE